MKNREIKNLITDNHFFYILLGAIVAIITARLYVLLGGSLNVVIGGFEFHHIILGIFLVLVGGLVYFAIENSGLNKTKKFFIFLFGAGTGLIIDEMSFLFSAANFYELTQYYSAENAGIELFILTTVLILFIISIIIRFKFDQNIQKRYDHRRR